uniref:Uncharacterized protein n=1 Tax=Romanomermis culicivorax TaxID=13658 RepID=A0A915I168_ROMCU
RDYAIVWNHTSEASSRFCSSKPRARSIFSSAGWLLPTKVDWGVPCTDMSAWAFCSIFPSLSRNDGQLGERRLLRKDSCLHQKSKKGELDRYSIVEKRRAYIIRLASDKNLAEFFSG